MGICRGIIEGSKSDTEIEVAGKKIMTIFRSGCSASVEENRLNIGRRGKLGGPGDGLTGITDTSDRTAVEIVEEAKSRFREEYRINKKKDFSETSTYPGITWFKYIKDRKPLLIIYFVDIEGQENQIPVFDKLKQSMKGLPSVGLAIGFPASDRASVFQFSTYRANRAYNWFELNDILAESEEEE